MQVDRWSLLALLRFSLATIVATNHLAPAVLPGRLGAFEAVLGFLAISGYSVAVSRARQPEGFLRRRIARVYPAYLACLALALLVVAFVDRKPLPGVAEIAANVVMLNQVLTTTSILGPAWSLALECWFYAMLPWLAAQPAGRVRRLAWFSFAAFAMFTVARTLFQWPYYAGVGFGANAILLAFAWLTGTLLARGADRRLQALRDLRWMFAGHIVLDALLQLGHRMKHHEAARFLADDMPGFCLQALTLWVVVRCFVHVSAAASGPRARSRWMTALGDWSYPLYLVHLSVFAIAARLGVASPTLLFILALVAAVVLHLGVERPWRRRAPAAAPDAIARPA